MATLKMFLIVLFFMAVVFGLLSAKFFRENAVRKSACSMGEGSCGNCSSK
ncbi:hypothetical protein K4L44_01245 [Halosquirtibacter laminarini]|uniref:Uncharacterized protein n=1 Tax=Halosquirtibacter laminarini TaxID=3374600 RepID=A0AC61NNQ4_9BACT|nr:hypothetical protein K4L44_01245 [Prolixibacteraceae bacterium]